MRLFQVILREPFLSTLNLKDSRKINTLNNDKLSYRSKILLLDSFKPSMKKWLILFCATLSLTSQATEQNSPFYAGIGIAKHHVEERGFSSNENGFTLLGGYSYSNFLRAEMSLFNLGDHKTLRMKGNGASFSVVGSYPIMASVSFIAEFGGMSVDLDIDGPGYTSSVTSDEDILENGRDSSLYYAIGAKYRFKDWSIVMKKSRVDLDADMDVFH